jgi:hypothetical protein
MPFCSARQEFRSSQVCARCQLTALQPHKLQHPKHPIIWFGQRWRHNRRLAPQGTRVYGLVLCTVSGVQALPTD